MLRQDVRPPCTPEFLVRSSGLDLCTDSKPVRSQLIRTRPSEMISTRTHISLVLAILLGVSMLPNLAQAQTDPKSNAAPSPPADDADHPSWLFPIAKLDEALPRWLHIGGEYRDRLEGPMGI